VAPLVQRHWYAGMPGAVHPQLSPDGTRLSWQNWSDEEIQVWVAPVDRPGAARPVTDEAEGIDGHWWMASGRHLLHASDHAGDENSVVSSTDLETGQTVRLSPERGVRAWIHGPGSDDEHVIIGTNERDPAVFDLFDVDVRDGTRRRIHEGVPGEEVTFDRNLQPSVVARRLDDGSVVLLRHHPERGPEEILRVAAEDADSTGPVALRGSSLYLVDSRGRDTAALTRVDLETGQVAMLAEDGSADVDQVLLAGGRPVAVSFERERRAWRVLDPAYQDDFAAIDAKLAGDFWIASVDRGDTRWLISEMSDRSGLRHHLWHRRERRLSQFHGETGPIRGTVPMHPVTIRARDGLSLVSYLSLPAGSDGDDDGRPEAPVPMVLLVHGGPQARDVWGYHPEHQFLTNRGYGVLSVNYRGSTGFGKRFLAAGDRQWGRRMHDDLIDAVEWAIARRIAGRDQICIMGASYGGYAALTGLTMTPEVFACGVDAVGPSNLVTMLENSPAHWSRPAQMRRVGDWTTAEGRRDLLDRSPLSHVARIRRPLLVAHGAHDPRVRQSESDQLVAAMQVRRIPVTYLLFPDEGHGFHAPANLNAYLGVAEAFLAAHLGGRFQPLTSDELAYSSVEFRVGREHIPGLPPVAGKADRPVTAALPAWQQAAAPVVVPRCVGAACLPGAPVGRAGRR
jgi:dipeptidyl aminopeptidase/acylaminoacyl peptidase